MKTQILDLTPSKGQKSFYGKAKVITEGKVIKLQSYDTIVAEFDTKKKKMKVNGWYSNTTARHINSFLSLYGFKECSKKELLTYNK